MNNISLEQLRTLIKEILNDNVLIQFLDSAPIKIFDTSLIIKHQIDDCFIPCFTNLINGTPITYADLIKKAYPDSLTLHDTKERRGFKTFKSNIHTMKTRYPVGETYIPPFVHYISTSLIKTSKTHKQPYRNYLYKIFNASVYCSFMAHSEYIPYAHQNSILSLKETQKFFDYLLETNNYISIGADNTPDLLISHYYLDYYFSIDLFSRILDSLHKNSLDNNFRSYFKDKTSYSLYIDYFLHLCAILQESSGFYTKLNLFNEINKIFMLPELDKNKHLQYFSSPEECFKQCTYELILLNKIIYPYIYNLYETKLHAFFNIKTLKDIYIQHAIIQFFYFISNSKTVINSYKDIINNSMKNLAEIRHNVTFMDKNTLDRAYKIFYNYYPLINSTKGNILQLISSDIVHTLNHLIDIEFLKYKQQPL